MCFSEEEGECHLEVVEVTEELKVRLKIKSINYSKEPKSKTTFNQFTFFHAVFIQLEVNWKLSSASDWIKSV